MDFQNFSNSRMGAYVAMLIGRTLPPHLGFAFAERVADRLAPQKDSPLVKAIRLNQWVVSGKRATPEQLDHAVHQVLRHAAHCMFDLNHSLHQLEKIKEKVLLTPNTEELLFGKRPNGQGTLIVGTHLSNFDLGMMAMGLHGLDIQVLSYAQPPGGYKLQNRFRRKTGLDVTPIAISSLKTASQRLKEGGVVGTGVDRPVPDAKRQANFFGFPAGMPAGHIRLALETNASIRVFACHMLPDKRYVLDISDPVPMQPHADRYTAIRQNVEAVLGVIAAYIRQHPHQWLMYFPVWPQFAEQVP